MIEINLLPGSTKRAARRGKRRAIGGLSQLKLGMPSVDRMLAAVVLAWLVGAGGVGWMHFSTSVRAADLKVELQTAVRDSTRFSQQRAQGDSLAAQQAVVAQKLEVIQQIDAARYIWPHILDEVSRAVPSYVWLVNMSNAAQGVDLPRVRIEGMAGTTFALTQFMENLELSPFLQSVRLISSVQGQVENRAVHTFMVEVGFREPPADVIQTVPLFGAAAQEN
jgi:Tfp pilus assembly protein PilN